MITYTMRVESPWAPDRSFAYLADMTNFEEWDPGTSSARQVEGTGPGADATYDLKVGALQLRYRVQAYEPDRRFHARAEHALVHSSDEITIEPSGSGSLITYQATLQPTLVTKLIEPLFRRTFERMGDDAADGLAAATEGRRAG